MRVAARLWFEGVSQRIRRLQGVEIGFSSIEQASAVYDVVEHRVLSVPIDEALTELEIEEVMHLVSFMHRLRPLIEEKPEE